MATHGRRVNEFESLFFGFSPKGFTDGVFNAAVDSWREVVEEILLTDPHLAKATKSKNYRQQVFTRLFAPIFNIPKTFTEFVDYAMKFIFRIPADVTLPQHQRSQLLLERIITEERDFNVTEEEKKIKRLEEKLIESRFVLAELNAQLEETNDVLTVFESIEKRCAENGL